MQSTLSTDLTVADNRAQYDEHAKNILADPHIFAMIMKRVVREAKRYSVKKLVSCIQGDIEISKIPVNPGATNCKKLRQGNNESKIPYEGVYFYDLRADVLLPHQDKPIKVIIDLEAQKEFDPGYKIETRGVYYGARMITAQSGTEFNGDDFDSIKKVYSIWICFNSPKYIGNAIAEYYVKKHDIVKGMPNRREAYDKLSVVVIALNEDIPTDDPLQKMLCKVFSKCAPVAERKEILMEAGIPLESGTMKEVDMMCNLSGLVADDAYKKGQDKGRVEGRSEGMDMFGKLISMLMQKGRTLEVEQVASDPVKRDELLKFYHIC